MTHRSFASKKKLRTKQKKNQGKKKKIPAKHPRVAISAVKTLWFSCPDEIVLFNRAISSHYLVYFLCEVQWEGQEQSQSWIS